jgi:hypothetical protein
MLLSKTLPRAPGLIALLTVSIAFAGATTAQAACYSSTPASAAYSDSPADGYDLAPEITTVTATVNASCAYSVDPGIPYPLVDGDAVFQYLDTDGNAATGSPVFTGADVVIGSLGFTGPDPAPVKGVWSPATNSFSFTGAPSLAAVGTGGFTASLEELGVMGTPTTTTLRVASIWTGTYDNYFDFAPDPSIAPIALPVAFSTVAPPPPPAPVPQPPAPVAPAPVPVAAPVAAPAPAVTAPVAATGPKVCKVPALKRLRATVARAALRTAGCRFGRTQRAYSSSVASGRVIASLPKAGTRWSEPVDLVVSRGRKPKRPRARSASGAWDLRGTLEIAARRMDARAIG